MKFRPYLIAAALLALVPGAAWAQNVAIKIAPGNFAFVLPFQNSSTFNVLTQTPTPRVLGAPQFLNAASPPNCAISGDQSVGFTIDPTTCNLSLSYDYKMLNAGARNRWGKTRLFDITASKVGGGTVAGKVIATIDTSLYTAAGYQIPGLDVLVGVSDPTPYRTLGSGNMPVGWSYSSSSTSGGVTAGTFISPTQNSPPPLNHYDLTNIQVYQAKNKCFTGVIITQSKFAVASGYIPQASKSGLVENLCQSSQDWIVTNNVFDLNGDTYPIQSAAVLGGIGTLSGNVATECQWDCINLYSGIGGGNYLQTAHQQPRF